MELSRMELGKEIQFSVNEILANHGTNLKEVRGRCNMKNLVAARKEISRLLYMDFGYSKCEIANFLHRTHATVVHHLRPYKRAK